VKISQLYQISIGDKTHTGTLQGPLTRIGVYVMALFPFKEGRKKGSKEGRKGEGRKERGKEGREEGKYRLH
jgi:hypothetical protein